MSDCVALARHLWEGRSNDCVTRVCATASLASLSRDTSGRGARATTSISRARLRRSQRHLVRASAERHHGACGAALTLPPQSALKRLCPSLTTLSRLHSLSPVQKTKNSTLVPCLNNNQLNLPGLDLAQLAQRARERYAYLGSARLSYCRECACATALLLCCSAKKLTRRRQTRKRRHLPWERLTGRDSEERPRVAFGAACQHHLRSSALSCPVAVVRCRVATERVAACGLTLETRLPQTSPCVNGIFCSTCEFTD